ncbi:alpha/beta hydrolase [Oscillatoriales cyanobacterium USR001]|nr:alpha/beta hydrolase [Oscillatoriales cyanobacterium USR001]
MRDKNQICLLKPNLPRLDYPLFVFLPGMDASGELLRSQIPELSQGFDIRCLSIPTDDLANWDVLVDETISLITAEKVKGGYRSVYLCGESYGGCLAMKVILKAPQLFDRLILVNPASSLKRQPLIEWGSYLTNWLPRSFYPLSVLGLLPFLASLGKIEKSDRQALLAAMQAVPQVTSIWRLGLLRSFDVSSEQLRTIQQPTLIIASKADRLLPSVLEAKYLVKEIPNTQMVVLPTSGHACLLETDVDLWAILKERDFLLNREVESSVMRSP